MNIQDYTNNELSYVKYGNVSILGVILGIYVEVRNFYTRRMFKGMYFEIETSLPWNYL